MWFLRQMGRRCRWDDGAVADNRSTPARPPSPGKSGGHGGGRTRHRVRARRAHAPGSATHHGRTRGRPRADSGRSRRPGAGESRIDRERPTALSVNPDGSMLHASGSAHCRVRRSPAALARRKGPQTRTARPLLEAQRPLGPLRPPRQRRTPAWQSMSPVRRKQRVTSTACRRAGAVSLLPAPPDPAKRFSHGSDPGGRSRAAAPAAHGTRRPGGRCGRSAVDRAPGSAVPRSPAPAGRRPDAGSA